jgi:small subunit ribosomal protein S17
MIIKKGTVTKISGDKTIKVEVREYRAHPKYKKQYLVTKNFLAHDEGGKAQLGDVVSIKQCRPISKRKSWVLITE